MSVGSNIRAGLAYVEVTAETSKLQKNLTAAQAELRNFGSACTAVGRDLLMVSAAMAAPLVLSIKSFAKFDDQMRLVRAVTQATDGDFADLTTTAQRLGRETSYTAQQVAEGMTSLGRMGFKPAEIQNAIAPVMNLARATGTELAESADIAANSLRIFGLESTKMSSVADVLTTTANGSAQTLTDLFEALKMAGPQARVAGESITDTSASIGVLANMGIKGSLAGTALRKSFSRMAQTKVQDILKSVGVEAVDSSGNLRKMADILTDLARGMQGMGSAEKIAFAEEIFDIRGSLAGLSLTTNIKGLEDFRVKLQDIEGVAAATSKAMDAGIGGSFRLFMSAVEGAMNAIGAAVNKTLQPLIDKITVVINEITKWIEANAGLVTAFAVAVAGAAAFGVALIAIGLASKSVAAGITVVQTAMKSLSVVQGLVVAQGTVLGNSLSLLTQAFTNYKNAAIPAMVGTSQLLAALNLPLDVRAKQIAAGLVLMKNAEAAAAGKNILAAKFSAVCAALKSLNSATIAATVSTKAHAVAEAASALGTKVLIGVRSLAAGVTALFSAANIKAAATATAGGAANLFLALTTKAVAAGYLIATAAATAFCAIPVTWILIAVGAALVAVVYALSRAGKYTAQLSDKMRELREKGDELRKTDQLRMERLKQLADKQQLTNVEMAEAKKLAAALQQKYGELGISISDNAQRITLLNTAIGNLGNIEMKVDGAEDLDKVNRLKALSMQVKLETGDQAEAEKLIGELSAKYGELGVEVDKVSGRIVALSDAARRMKSFEVEVTDSDDLEKLTRLKQLSFELDLTIPEQNEAEYLIAELGEKYSELGVTVDRVTGRIVKMNTAAGSLRDVELKVRGEEDLAKLQRLKALSLEVDLDINGQAEAEQLVSELTAKYGDLGLEVQKAGARITAMNDAVSRLRAVELQVTGEEDLAKFEKLKSLSMELSLDASGQEKATALIAELSKKYGALGVAVDQATGRIATLNTTVGNLQDVRLRVSGEEDLQKLDRLKSLSMKLELDTSEQAEATRLVGELEGKYGSLGIAVDGASKRIVALDGAATRLRNLKIDVDDTEARQKVDRLEELMNQPQKLDASGQAEAGKLIEELEQKYGSLGLAVDAASGRIIKLNSLVGQIQDIRPRITVPEDLGKLDRLQKLSIKVSLDVDEQAEAGRLVSELTAKYGDLGIAVESASAKISSLNATATRLNSVRLQVTGQEDLEKLNRLKALSLKVNLEAGEQTEADRLIGDLGKKYGELGVAVDKTAQKIVRLNTAGGQLRDISIKVQGAEDLGKLDRLKELSLTSSLDSGQQDLANQLISDLTAKYGQLGVSVDAVKGRIVAMTDAQRQFAQATQIIQAGNDPLKETHLAQLERLKKLAEQESLTADEQVEAQKIVNALNGSYGSLGLGIDTITGKLNMAAGAQSKLNDAMKEATLAELDAEMAEVQANMKELEKENEALMSYWNHNLWSQMSGAQDEALGKLEVNGDKAVANLKRLNALRQRKKAVEQDHPGATTGEDGTGSPEQIGRNVEEDKARQAAAADAAEKAADRIAEIDKKLARERQTELQNEIQDIEELRDEYKALIKTMLDFERSKPEKEQDKKKIAELEGKLADADKVAQERIKKAQDKAREKMEKDVADLQGNFDRTAEDIQKRRAEDAKDREIDKALKENPAEGINMLNDLINSSKAAASAAKAEFDTAMADAQKDGTIDDKERERINKAQQEYSASESLVDKYEARLREAQEATSKNSGPSVQGNFLAAALENLGSGGTAADRTAKATEAIADNTKKANTLLKKGSGIGTFK